MPLPLFAAHAPRQPTAVPGARICLKTYGCAHNASDSEYMAGQLAAAGYLLTEDPQEADLLLINSCTVKGPSQDSFLQLVRSASKPLVVAGCVPQADPMHPQLQGVSTIGVRQIDRVVEVVEETLRGNTVRLLSKAGKPGLDLPKVRRNRFVEIIPISTGCLSACTYCKTKHARGHLASYLAEDILARVQEAITEGVVEIWLTSEDSGAYGRDIGTDLPTLLERIVAVLPPSVMLRVGMTNPPYILEHLERMARVLNHPNVYAFLHVPVQSGSDRVLAGMRRQYTADEFRRVVRFMRCHVPGITIASDIICGFPTETAADFARTLALVRELRLPVLHISQFYPRPGTPAARMRLLPTQEVKRRSAALTRLFKSQRPYDALVGTRQRVWCVEYAQDGTHLMGRTKHYVPVLLPPDDSLLGRSLLVGIVAAGKHFVRGIPSSP